MDNALKQVMPHDLLSETAVLNLFLTDYDSSKIYINSINEEDFYFSKHKIIFESIKHLFEHKISVDVVTLTDHLKTRDDLEKIGGLDFIVGIVSSYAVISNIQAYIDSVVSKANLRKLINISKSITEKAYKAQENIEEIIDFAQKEIFDLKISNTDKDFTRLNDVLNKNIQILEKRLQGEEKGVESGFKDLDARLGGFSGGALILVGARPAMGKTAFLLNISMHIALKKQVTTAFFSLEMSDTELGFRILTSDAKLDSQNVKTGSLSENDWESIAVSLDELHKANFYINDKASITLAELRSKCRRLVLEQNLGLIIIDYLQLINPSNSKNAGNRQQEISEISRTLKILAKDLNVPIIVASQLSRALESRHDKRPMLSDLRESGAIEQDADVVLFLYRDEVYNPGDNNDGKAEVIIAKNRSGSTGTVELTFIGKRTQFTDAFH